MWLSLVCDDVCVKAGMLLSALTSCGREDLATYVKVRHESSKRDLIHKTQGTTLNLTDYYCSYKKSELMLMRRATASV